MSNSKLKQDNNVLGGINNKVSPFKNTNMEFLDLCNYDFQTPGALTGRWGSTQYIGPTFPAPVSSIFEFIKQDGSSYMIFGYSGGIEIGATTGTHQGISLVHFVGATKGWGINAPEYVDNTGSGYLFDNNSLGDASGAGPIPFMGDWSSRVYLAGGAYTSTYKRPMSFGNNDLSFATMNNWLFMADGNKFIKTDGTNFNEVGLIWPIASGPAGATQVSGTSGAFGTTFSAVGDITLWGRFVNNRGYEGPSWPLFKAHCGASLKGPQAFATFAVMTPLEYGISYINLYYSYGASQAMGHTQFWNQPKNFMQRINGSGSTVTYLPFGGIGYPGTAAGQTNYAQQIGGPNLFDDLSRFPLGFTLIRPSAQGITAYGDAFFTEASIIPFFPTILEVHKSRMYATGFSGSPSTVVISESGEPEAYDPENAIETVTQNPNSPIENTAMKSYKSAMYIFKRKSVFGHFGDIPNDFVQELTDEYGCLNKHCVVTFKNVMAFLDEHGVVVYNGAQFDYLSKRVKPFFERMNVSAAISKARMAHDQLRSQIIVSIPVDGSATNNMNLIYDYEKDDWARQDGYSPSILATAYGRNSSKNLFYGSYSGAINWFGSSFLSDNGTGFTTYFKSRFFHEMGDSVQEQFRRLYLNISPPSATMIIPLKFYQDYGSSVVLSATLAMSTFQERYEFGISGKAMAFEMFNRQTTDRLKLYAFTVEPRMQRKV